MTSFDARYYAVVLDCSSSMGVVQDATIRTFNEQVETIQKAAVNEPTFVSLTLFSTVPTVVFENEKADRLKPLTRESYIPNGNTAELDAIGDTLERLEKEVKPNCPVLVIIISDGEENASIRFTQETIAAKIKALQATGFWTFVFAGANVDVLKIAKAMNIPVGNTVAYTSTDAGTRSMSQTLSTASAGYSSSGASASVDFFSGPDAAQAPAPPPQKTGTDLTSDHFKGG